MLHEWYIGFLDGKSNLIIIEVVVFINNNNKLEKPYKDFVWSVTHLAWQDAPEAKLRKLAGRSWGAGIFGHMICVGVLGSALEWMGDCMEHK